jgi:hypothetical protein
MNMRIIGFTQRDDQDKSVVELSFKTMGDLVDQNDPSPYPLKELTEVAEDAIADHVGDVPIKKKVELIIKLPENALNPEIQGRLPDTIHQHFTLRASEKAVELKRIKLRVRFGLKLIATTVTITILVLGILHFIQSILTSIEHDLIVGIFTILNWVALWDTYETRIFDYRGLAKEKRIYEKIARMEIRATGQ